MKKMLLVATLLSLALVQSQAQNWLLTGNAGTTAGTNFIGTTDAKDLYFKTSNATGFVLKSTGKIGIGTTTPTGHFDISDSSIFSAVGIANITTRWTGAVDVRGLKAIVKPSPGYGYGLDAVGGFIGVKGQADATTYTSEAYGVWGTATGSAGLRMALRGDAQGTGTALNYGVYATANSATSGTNFGVYASAQNSTGVNYGVYSTVTGTNSYAGYFSGRLYASGNVGLGVTAPSRRLEIGNGRIRFNGYMAGGYASGIEFGDSAGTTTNKGFIGMYNDKALGFYGFAGAGYAWIYDVTNGNTGFGTVTPPSRLDVVDGAAATVGSFATTRTGTVDVIGVKSTALANNGYGIGMDVKAGYKGINVSITPNTTRTSYGSYISLVRGSAANYTGTSYGSYVTTSGGNGINYGVYATTIGGLTASYGMYASCTGFANVNYGIYATAKNGMQKNWAGYFSGNTYATNLVLGNDTAPATGYALTVGGKIIAEEVKVQLQPFPDYVFESNYSLRPLEEVEQYINDNKHLPGMPTACEAEEGNVGLGELNRKLVEKVEELTLYVIELKKQNDQLLKSLGK